MLSIVIYSLLSIVNNLNVRDSRHECKYNDSIILSEKFKKVDSTKLVKEILEKNIKFIFYYNGSANKLQKLQTDNPDLVEFFSDYEFYKNEVINFLIKHHMKNKIKIVYAKRIKLNSKKIRFGVHCYAGLIIHNQNNIKMYCIPPTLDILLEDIRNNF